LAALLVGLFLIEIGRGGRWGTTPGCWSSAPCPTAAGSMAAIGVSSPSASFQAWEA